MDDSFFNRLVENEMRDDKRAHTRHELRLQVTVIKGCRSFTTFTRNVSLGGLLLERSIPAEMSKGTYRVILASAKGRHWIEAQGQLAIAYTHLNRLSFGLCSPGFLSTLQDWITGHSDTKAA